MSPCWAEGWAGLSYPFIDIIIPLAETLYSALELEWFKSVFLNTKSYFFLTVKMGQPVNEPRMPVDRLRLGQLLRCTPVLPIFS